MIFLISREKFNSYYVYYSEKEESSLWIWNSMFNIMKKVPTIRLYIGGLLGPLTAFLYALSFYHIVLMTTNLTPLAWTSFIISACGIIFGGAYHLETAILGLLVKNDHETAVKIIFKYFNLQGFILMLTAGIGLLLMFILLVSGNTVFPFWLAFVSPMILMLLLPLLHHLPKHFHMIICGGWSNIPFIIYYTVALILALNM